MSQFWTVAVLAVGLSCWAPASGVGQDKPSAVEDRARVTYLIGLLASKNREPAIEGSTQRGEDETITFPKDYEKSLQVPVYLALQQLLAEGELAFDLLLAHTGDRRYSYSVNSSRDYNVSVSQVCERIVRRNLLPLEPELHVITRSQFGLYPSLKEFDQSLVKWWQKHKHRGLAALQVEGIDATIAFMEKVDGKTALPWHAAAERLPVKEFDRLREENLRILKATRQFIVEKREPYRPKRIYDRYDYIMGLPWTGRQHNK